MANRWRHCPLQILHNNLWSYLDTISTVRNFSPWWPDTVSCGEVARIINCVWVTRANVTKFPMRLVCTLPQSTTKLSSQVTKTAQRWWKDGDVQECHDVMSPLFTCSLYLQYKLNLCTSQCFKASCVGEDRKSFHQLATDSVWETFTSRWTVKTFSFQHLTTADNVPIHMLSGGNRVIVLFIHWRT